MGYSAFMTSLELGFVYGFVALGVFISFRVLDFPDLTADGSFPAGAAVAASLIVNGHNPFLATAAAVLVGALCGIVTAALNRKFKILHLLAGILTMIAMFSINLRIMGQPNTPLLGGDTVLTPLRGLGLELSLLKVLFAGTVVLIFGGLLSWFLLSDAGLAMRATGANPRMARANGIDVDYNIYLGLALSNGLIALGGALFAQLAGFADVQMGSGTILIGLAAVILGEALFRVRALVIIVFACIVGSIAYRLAIGFALNSQSLGLRSSDLRLVTAVLVAVAFIVSTARRNSNWIPWRRTVRKAGQEGARS
ncbi:ABC transporter permease [Rhizobium sp. BR 362]|uniref:ABC transporter permease n=1 Tax=Rhizobium sp. BR 362 TaxID=3040670 RepID=UPI002F406BF4